MSKATDDDERRRRSLEAGREMVSFMALFLAFRFRRKVFRAINSTILFFVNDSKVQVVFLIFNVLFNTLRFI